MKNINWGSVFLGVLLGLLAIRALYFICVTDAAMDWNKRRASGEIGPGEKPWYVLRYERWEAKRHRFGRF